MTTSSAVMTLRSMSTRRGRWSPYRRPMRSPWTSPETMTTTETESCCKEVQSVKHVQLILLYIHEVNNAYHRIQNLAPKFVCTKCTSRARNEKSLTVQGPLKDPGSARDIDALSCYLSLISKHSDAEVDFKKKNIDNQN